jgi:NTE family protein
MVREMRRGVSCVPRCSGVVFSNRPQSLSLCLGLFLLALLTASCAHAPVNLPLRQGDPAGVDLTRVTGAPEKSGRLLVILTFSGGGTRAASFAYGVLEELRRTEVTIDGKRHRLLDEVNAISSVSGGSFTAGYYGLFGDRIFEDFESRFLKANIEGNLIAISFFNPVNWIRLWSPNFGRSDLAAEYYDKEIFDGGTFGDIMARGGPTIIMNATDMISGVRVGFSRQTFDLICSDLSRFPVARAAAASSAVPVVLSPITLHNYAGTCGYQMPAPMEKVLQDRDHFTRRYHIVHDIVPYLDAEKRKYIHLVDGGVADNLGLRAAIDRALALGDFWTTLQYFGLEKVQKVVFIVVNAQKEMSEEWYLSEGPLSLGVVANSYSGISIDRANYETIMLMRDSFRHWTEEVQQNRCGSGQVSTEPGACGDLKFYLVQVKFDALKDEGERVYLNGLPTSFSLSSGDVDKLRDAARRILVESEEFQRLLRDLK